MHETTCPKCGLEMDFDGDWMHMVEYDANQNVIACEHINDPVAAEERRQLNAWAERASFQVDSREIREQIAQQIEAECYYLGDNKDAIDLCMPSVEHEGCHHKRDADIARGLV